jgi:hypothetical protein
MKRLNILELHRTINEKNMRKTETYEKVLESCHRKITLGSQTRQLRCMFEVPEYIPGYPIFDLNSCIKFLMATLKANGFLVNYYFPKILYISWDFDEIREDSKPKNALNTLISNGQNKNIQKIQNNGQGQQYTINKYAMENNNNINNLNSNPLLLKNERVQMNNNKDLLTSSLKLQKKKTGKLELNLY